MENLNNISLSYLNGFLATRREDQKEAEIISHNLLLRASFIQKTSSGIYQYLPLGNKVLQRVESILRKNLDSQGCLEVRMSVLQPAEIWQRSGRYDAMGSELVRLTNRNQKEFILGPTHEEVVSTIVEQFQLSYKNLPTYLYQIQTKIRDEIRPRFGVIRAKEFIMKDGYSFHSHQNCLDQTYDKMFTTYMKFFKDLGLPVVAVQADSGNIGGNLSHEFMLPLHVGEERIVSCSTCEYASNIEVGQFKVKDPITATETTQNKNTFIIREIHTPNQSNITSLSQAHQIPLNKIVKTLIFKNDTQLLALSTLAHREINPTFLNKKLGSTWTLADDQDIENHQLPVGYLGPIAWDKISSIPLICDTSLQQNQNLIVGANKKDYHYEINTQALSESQFHFETISEPLSEDSCPNCSDGLLKITHGLELGHIFKLQDKYSQSMKITYRDQDGQEKPYLMGCYGIGVSRILSALVESYHDDNGITWPIQVAPFEVILIKIDDTPEINQKINQIVHHLQIHSHSVYIDDRKVRPGIKFKDWDLIGIPVQVILGKRSFEKGFCEVKIRQTGLKNEIPHTEIEQQLITIIQSQYTQS